MSIMDIMSTTAQVRQQLRPRKIHRPPVILWATNIMIQSVWRQRAMRCSKAWAARN